MRLPLCIALVVALAATFRAGAAQPLPTLKPYKGPALDTTGAVESKGFETDSFTIACWLPSLYDLDKWVKRGVNVAWYNQRLNPKEKPLADYVARAQAAGIKTWRYPAEYMEPPADPAIDTRDSSLVAYSLLDEPILHRKTPEDMMDQAKAFREVNPKMKLILNLEGDKFVMPNPGPKVVADHTGYMEAADIGFVDWYVKNRNADRYPLSHLWTAVERLCIWGKGKPVGAFVECSNQKIAAEGREPTVGEMRGEIIGSIIHGARLIAYFPESPGQKQNKGKQFGNGNDATPPDLEREMVSLNKQLQSLAPILCADGARLTTLPEPLIGAVRDYKGNRYLIVFNNDDEDKTQFNGETLEPYDWRIYTAGPAPKK
jgi:hypothetical protein